MGTAPTDGQRGATPVLTCTYCSQPIPTSIEPVTGPGTGPLAFCTETCADASAEGREPFVGTDSFRLMRTGVRALDTLLPWGMPANSMVLLAGEEGLRHRGLQTELAWRALQRGEPVVFVSFLDTPVSILEQFRAFGWNLLPYLESGDAHVIDCFTNRLRKEHRLPERQVAWNDYVESFFDGTVTEVREPEDLREVETKLHDALDANDVLDEGVVLVDSINEATSRGREFQTEQFVAEVRADVCKRRFVPMFVSTTITDDATFARDQGYLFDGIVDMRHNGDLVRMARLKQLSVRKMDGVRYLPDWAAYENLGDGGFQVFDPATQLDAVYGHPDRVSGTRVDGADVAGSADRGAPARRNAVKPSDPT